MFEFRTAARVALITGLLAGVVAWIALQLHLRPMQKNTNRETDRQTARTLAVELSKKIAANQKDDAINSPQLWNDVRAYATSRRNIDQIRLIDPAGRTVLLTTSKSGTDQDIGILRLGNTATRPEASVDIESDEVVLGRVTIYCDDSTVSVSGGYFSRRLGIVFLLAAGVALACWALFTKAWSYISPSDDVPQRVVSALDRLTEGVVVLKYNGIITHCNEAFCDLVSNDPLTELASVEEMIGKELGAFEWQVAHPKDSEAIAWDQCRSLREAVVGQVVVLTTRTGTSSLSVNASPVLCDKGTCQGTLVSFGDVTETENQRAALEETLRTVEEQNHQLSLLASYDTLTQCVNRREFFRVFDRIWQEPENKELTLLMLDVDFFKAINDTRGHTFGDKVLVHVSDKIRGAVGELGTVCRYGGEEFIVLLNDLELERAEDVAEDIRKAIAESPVDGEGVSISIGLSHRQFKAMDQQHLLDQADEALYAAKNLGRNRVVRFDQCPTEEEIAHESRAEATERTPCEVEYSAVIGLLSSLSFRCQATASHSIRVAKLVVEVGRNFVQGKDLYRLEIAALLHDVGKIGIPDAVLCKAGPLTEKEWEIMNRDDEIGLQIVGNTIESIEILDVLKCRHYGFQPSHAQPHQLLFGEDIPVMSRILYVCDAFDSMVSERAFKERMSIPAVLVELLRCSPGQFDEGVVRHLVEHVREHGYETLPKADWHGLDPRSAVSIGSYIEVVYQGLETDDFESLRKASRSLRTHASKVFAHDLVDATIDLEEAVNVGMPDEQIQRIAGELIELCRETRQSIIKLPGAVKLEGELEVRLGTSTK